MSSEAPATAWPKPFLLQLYQRAVTEGCIRVDLGGDEIKYASLRAAFYRLRRRKDAQHTAFIEPSFHMVTVTWEADRGSMLITYDRLPDGAELPRIESVAPSERMAMPVPRAVPEPESLAEPEPAADLNSADFIQSLVAKAGVSIKDDLEEPIGSDEIGH